jgi:site-specific DNA recombinase
VLRGKPQPAGLVGRAPAAEIEALVVAALRNHLNASGAAEPLPDDDRDLLERHLERVTLTPNHLELRLWQSVEAVQAHNTANDDSSAPRIANVTTIIVPWTSHVPAHNTPMTPSHRDALLMAIAKARNWADEMAHGRVGSFAMLARREGKVERHIRLLLPLAFLSPRIVAGLLDGTAPANLTITALARALPWSWAEQERRLGLHRD